MRWCVIGPTYPFRGGIAHYTTLLTKALREGHEVLLVSFSRQYPQLLFPGTSDRDPSGQPLLEEAEFLIDSINPLTWVRTLQRIAAWRPDIVVMQWWVPFWALPWATISRGLRRMVHPPRVVFVCHNVLPHEPNRFAPRLARLALAKADGYLVHAQSDRRVLASLLPGRPIVVSPHPTYRALGGGLEAEKNTLRRRLNLPTDRPLLLFCGLIRPYKGLDILLDAMPQVLARRQVHLAIVGEVMRGDNRAYEQQLQQHGLREHVKFVNAYVPDEVLVQYIRAADVVVLPYRSATQSGMIQTAFGHGTPVITTDVGGLAEAVRDGSTGLLVPPEQPAALAAAIEEFFAADLAEQMRANIAQYNAQFDWHRLVTSLQFVAAAVKEE